MKKYKLVTGAVAILLGIATIASAAPITGTLNINGSVLVNATTINWIPPGPGGPETGFGTFQTVVPGTGYFANIPSNPPCPPGSCYFGDSRDITRVGGGAPPNPAFAPVNVIGAPLVTGFLRNFTAPTYGGLSFDLTLILLSQAPVCDGSGTQATCRPDAGSPFTFTRLVNGTSIALEVNGIFRDSNVADSAAQYVGRYATTISDSIEQINTIVGGGGQIQAAYGANFNPIPEPGTIGLGLMGLSLIVGGLYRRRSN